MASAQVLPNSASSTSRKHLEAGKRRLEEFRKKKEKGRAKKPVSTDPQQLSDVRQDVPQTLETGSDRPVDLEDVTVTTSGTHTGSSLPDNGYNVFSADSNRNSVNHFSLKEYQVSEPHLNHDTHEDAQINREDTVVPPNLFPRVGYSDGHFNQPIHSSIKESRFGENEGHLKVDSGTFHFSDTKYSSQKHTDAVPRHTGYPSTPPVVASAVLNEDSVPSTSSLAESYPRAEEPNGSMFSDAGRMKFINSFNQESSADSTQWRSSEPVSSGFSFDYRSNSNHIPPNSVTHETVARKNRLSFLDSLDLPRGSTFSHSSFTQSEKAEPSTFRNFKVPSADTLASSTLEHPVTNYAITGSSDKLRSSNLPDTYDYGNKSTSVEVEDGIHSQGFADSVMKWKHEVPTEKKDENFAALEQYIEDLTQEKFSLTRDLEASRALAESLASENSSLTDSYNQQRAAVNQLKADMESLQEEIKAQLLELDSIKLEYSIAQSECNASDERVKILASEIIGLEEKALKLRSSELKLERQLENSNAEIASYKKKISSLQKERQDLQLTIDALQEEKKLMQSKLRKAAGNAKSVEAIKTPAIVKNVSTSTEDLGFDPDLGGDMNSDVNTMRSPNHEMRNVWSSSTSTIQLNDNRELQFPVASAVMPPDQLRMVENINSLISELALEKEELVRALNSETCQSSKLKELNKELSRKLEVQTQRLELLTAQSMSNENILARRTDSRPAQDSITAYTDEGDEVVERVLGWIMKLFPGGPSKRRTSRLL